MKSLTRRIANLCKRGRMLSAWIPWMEFIAAAKNQEEKKRSSEFTVEAEKVVESKRRARQEIVIVRFKKKMSM
ncbi:hypothetical protein TrLO_g12834, partial [Triparma laevis f. longispina]